MFYARCYWDGSTNLSMKGCIHTLSMMHMRKLCDTPLRRLRWELAEAIRVFLHFFLSEIICVNRQLFEKFMISLFQMYPPHSQTNRRRLCGASTQLHLLSLSLSLFVEVYVCWRCELCMQMHWVTDSGEQASHRAAPNRQLDSRYVDSPQGYDFCTPNNGMISSTPTCAIYTHKRVIGRGGNRDSLRLSQSTVRC